MTELNHDETDIDRMSVLIHNHYKAGRTAADPRLRTDLETQRYNIDKVLDKIEIPASTDARISWIVRELARQGRRQEEMQVALIDDIQAAATSTGTAANDAANRVIAAYNDKNAEIADLKAKAESDAALIAALQAQIDAGNITPEAAQAVIDTLAATNARLADLDSDPVTPI